MFTYQLIPGGYEIFVNGRPYFRQTHPRDEPGNEGMTPEAAEADALAVIAEIQANDGARE